MRLSLVMLLLLLTQPSAAQDAHAADAVSVDRWMTELSNWNRWGPDDRLGALNLITPSKRRAAAHLVRDGVTVSLAHLLSADESNDERSAFRHQMFVSPDGPFVSDRYSFTYHGPTQSHFDALCHMAYRGKMYNGVPRSAVSNAGCASLSVADVKDGIVTRGVLMDIARLKGVEFLPAGTPIYAEDLEDWEKKSGVKVQSGDALLLRTGRWAGNQDHATPRSGAGLHVSGMKWLKARDIALIGSDYATDVAPSGIDGVALPDHQLLIVAMGVRILDNLDLEALGREAAARQRWEFMLTVAPLAINGGTGSPINPLATF